MARPERGGRRGWTALLLTLLLCGIFSVVHRRSERSHVHDPVTGVVRDAALVPAQSATERTARWWHDNVASIFSGPRLARQNASLQSQVETLTRQNQQLQAAQAENHRLRLLLRFQDRAPRPLLAAEVVALKPSSQIDTLILARGLREGVRPQTVVLAPNGALVGQVLEASSYSSAVLLMTDSASSVGAQTSRPGRSGAVGIVQGDRAGHLLLNDLPGEADVRIGDSVTTSGLGGVFPKGIPIGTVQTVVFDKTRALKTARVRPAADFDHLEEAFLRLAPPSAAGSAQTLPDTPL